MTDSTSKLPSPSLVSSFACQHEKYNALLLPASNRHNVKVLVAIQVLC